jgi:hypothetical protein
MNDLHEDVLTQLLSLIILSNAKDDVMHTDLVLHRNLACVCKSFKKITDSLPLRLYIDTVKKLNIWIDYSSNMPLTQTREKSIFRVNMDFRKNVCQCILKTTILSISVLSPSIIILELDSISPSLKNIKKLQNGILTNAKHLKCICISNWTLPVSIITCAK